VEFFFSISKGMPTGIAALIVTLQPILTNALSGPILNEKVTNKQWIGVLLGFVGATLVLGLDIGSEIPVTGLIATIVALIAITSSTIWQKKLSNNLPLSISNMYQAIGGFSFHLLVIIFFRKTIYRFFTNIYNCNESSNIFSIIRCFYNIDVFN
jgi:drug/metabolite transporter (DMT)-like permease